ncbi:hypothetical protein HDE_14258 [Halotydeus destructor]|nr:hypothetical protein HDE_14258 [Halotydeus destructor]
MINENQRLHEEASNLYIHQMADVMSNKSQRLNGLELRNEHAQAKLFALDHVRIQSKTVANTWKLERDLDCLFTNLRTTYRGQVDIGTTSFVDMFSRRGSRGPSV